MMLKLKAKVAVLLVLALSACGQSQMISREAGADRPWVAGPSVAGSSVVGASNAASAPKLIRVGGIDMVMVPVSYDVEKVEVIVPRTLRVSEANTFVPRADIVWHGDMLGNRYDQVQAVLLQAAQAGTQTMKVGRPVAVEMEVTRFHALTPKARYTTGGNFATHFLLTVRDLATGEVIDGPRIVVADTWAAGGQRAMEEEAAGITQKVVIVSHVAGVLSRELSQRLVPADQVPDTTVTPQALSSNNFAPGNLAALY